MPEANVTGICRGYICGKMTSLATEKGMDLSAEEPVEIEVNDDREMKPPEAVLSKARSFFYT